MKKCKECGYELPDTAKFCSQCRVKQEMPEVPKTLSSKAEEPKHKSKKELKKLAKNSKKTSVRKKKALPTINKKEKIKKSAIKIILFVVIIIIFLIIGYRIFVIQYASSKLENAQDANNTFHQKERDLGEVITFLEKNSYIKGKKVNSLYFETYLGRGNTRLDLKKYNDALSDFDLAVTLHPNMRKPDLRQLTYIYLLRGKIYETTNQYKLAIDEYTEGIKIGYGFYYGAELYENRGMIYFNDEKYDKAIDDFTKIINTNGYNINILFKRGEAYIFTKQYQLAIDDFNSVIKYAPDNFYAYANRGLAYRNLNRNNEAVQDFLNALKLNEDNNNEDEAVFREWVRLELNVALRYQYSTN